LEELIRQYLIEDALIIVPALLFLGYLFKNTPSFKDWLIPYALTAIGVVLALLLLGLSVDAFLQGVLVSGAAVLGNQFYKQLTKEDE
jgi:hypothetical protein